MAIQKIDYEDKIGLQNDPNVPDKNKVLDEDMNEIKSVVNNNADELTTAQQNIEDLEQGQGTASGDIASLKNRVTTLEKDNTKNKQDIANKVDKVEGKGLSTEDYTTAEKQKLAGLSNYDDTEIKQDIQELQTDVSDIKSEQEEQNDLLERTQSALINITTEKSSNINVKDSSDLNAKIDVFGISEQETREGYNLFNNTKTISNVTYNSEEDKWIFYLSNRYDHIAQKGTFFKNIKANTNYTLYFNILKNTSSAAILFNLTNTIWNNNIQISAGQTGVVVNNIKTREDLSTALYDLWFSHLNTITGEFEVQIMLVEGTFTSENIPDYEQYGASPSPEFPSEIQNVTGDIDITVCNKNLFTGFTKGKGLNGTTGEETTNSTGAVSNFIEVDFSKNSNYYLSGLTNTLNSYIAAYNKNKEFLGRIGANAQTNISFNKDSFTLYSAEGDIAFVRVTQYEITTSTGTIDDIDDLNVQLEANNVATDFIAHEEQLITFPLAQGQRLMEKDYPASDGIHHVRKQVVLDGTENWIVSGNSYYLTVAGKKLRYELTKGKMLCTHFKETEGVGTGDLQLNEFFEGYYVTGNRNAFFNYDNGVGGVDNWKSYLAEQKQAGTPVILEYELEEEEIEPYTEEQQEAYNQLQNVLSYYNETNVFTDKAQLVFKYIADTQTWTVNLVKSEVANTNQQILEIAGGN